MPNYSQFWETEAGDWVRSSLRGGAGIKAKRSFTFYTSTKAISNERTGYPTGIIRHNPRPQGVTEKGSAMSPLGVSIDALK